MVRSLYFERVQQQRQGTVGARVKQVLNSITASCSALTKNAATSSTFHLEKHHHMRGERVTIAPSLCNLVLADHIICKVFHAVLTRLTVFKILAGQSAKDSPMAE
jgi:hypothetical protein